MRLGRLIPLLSVALLLLVVPAAHAGLVVWAKNPSTNAPSGTWGEIWFANEDGSNARVLFAPAGKLPGVPAPFAAAQLRSPQLSDDGRTLTFSAQWNQLWFRGLATSCGLGCEGIYQVKDGVVTRISPDPTNVGTNGCPGAAVTDLCESFETGAVQLGDAILFSFTRDDWTNCVAQGSCPQSPTSSSTSIDAYRRQANGTFTRETVFSSAGCTTGTVEPQTYAFDAAGGAGGGVVFNGCTSAQSGGPVSTPDQNGAQVDIGIFHRSPNALAVAPDLSRVLAADAKPALNDDQAVWSFPIVQGGAGALTPADYILAIRSDAANALSPGKLALGAATLWTDASDGNLWRWPVTCGTSVTCSFGQEGQRVTNDSGATLSGPNGYWTGFVRFNRDPRWTPATSADIGWPPPAPATPPAGTPLPPAGTPAATPAGKPKLSTVKARCASKGARCRLRISWVADRPGSVRITVKPRRGKAVTTRVKVRAGKGSLTLPARQRARIKGLTITVQLVQGAVKGPVVTVRPATR